MGEGMTSLPPGFHFYPSDEDLVIHFLHRKVSTLPCYPDVIPTVHLHRYDPWDLNGKALQAADKFYFFTRMSQSRGTPNGHWSQVGSDELITNGGRDVGSKKTLVFYIRDSQERIKTNWIMHEFHLLDGSYSNSSGGSANSKQKKCHSTKECNKWVLCRVFDSNGDSQSSFRDDSTELSCLDEVFLSLDDFDEVSLPN
ncbi:NAC domain-containing protein 104 [Rhynchospora pubera]|uniref:NAC domain-containing protein 104 n=1 Tax=Rhynchospora pubera TaxID=906938 RepID=A0AAV8H9E1_9POAL|nr:NAC domain-containing protein 104 [Rhynchospora pubera]